MPTESTSSSLDDQEPTDLVSGSDCNMMLESPSESTLAPSPCGSQRNIIELTEMDEEKKERRNIERTVSFIDVKINDEEGRSTNSVTSEDSSNSTVTFEKLKRLKSRLKLKDLSQNELELKASLYFHICNPLKRWKVERLVPYKLVLQIVKTILLILQVILFMYVVPSERGVFFYQTQFLFQELFVQAYSSISKTSQYSAHTREQIVNEITFAVERYYQLPNLTIGSYGHVLDDNDSTIPVHVKLDQYKIADFNPSTGEYKFDYDITTYNFNLESQNINGSSILEQLETNGLDMTFCRFIELELKFLIKSIHITKQDSISGSVPECFLFDVKLLYSYKGRDGKIDYYLNKSEKKSSCNGKLLSKPDSYNIFIVVITLLDLFITILCITSISFTIHTYRRAYNLGKAMGEFYQRKLRIKLSWWERRDLFSTWSLFTFFSDVLLILGSIIKILLQYNVFFDAICVRILLGSALIVQAGVMLRYFSFFKQLSVLTRTLSAASPELVKFLLCTSLLYFAFALCGLVVFGPYDEMFSNFGNSVEILFALINGDSIWLVFRAFDSRDFAIYIYSRCFVYSFIFLFIYAVLNLFTSLVKSSYDNSLSTDRATINEVRRFVFSGPLTQNGVALRDVTHVEKYVEPELILARRRRRKNSIGDLD